MSRRIRIWAGWGSCRRTTAKRRWKWPRTEAKRRGRLGHIRKILRSGMLNPMKSCRFRTLRILTTRKRKRWEAVLQVQWSCSRQKTKTRRLLLIQRHPSSRKRLSPRSAPLSSWSWTINKCYQMLKRRYRSGNRRRGRIRDGWIPVIFSRLHPVPQEIAKGTKMKETMIKQMPINESGNLQTKKEGAARCTSECFYKTNHTNLFSR